MKKAIRPDVPKTLRKNASKWRKELLDAIKEESAGGNPIPDKLYKRYAHASIREALQKMYSDRCCYCEAPIKVVSSDHIEHRMPKAKMCFPEHTFDWDNLHLACSKCNGAKSNKWNHDEPILDAAVDKIEDHLDYKEGGLGLYRWPKTLRGETTISHADLDREPLLNARTSVYLSALCAIREINEEYTSSPKSPTLAAGVRQLQAKAVGDFGSVMEYAMRVWLDNGVLAGNV